ncbi:MAG TPA: hypothetical protein VJL29_02770 [Thermoguttaceae bacterium]|nr:hypothetical protein [Thermoguttaceae bacterium]
MSTLPLTDFSWKRMIAAVEDVRERACRATRALCQAGIPCVVVGGNAVAAWVARVDEEAVRNTKDVDLLIRRQDFEQVVATLSAVGFVHQNVAGVDLFLDGPQGSVRSAIHLIFAGEKVRPDHPLPAPDLDQSQPGPDFAVPTLEALVRMKLTSFRLKDQVHLLDLLEVGLIDETWADRFPSPLALRLRQLVKTREQEA